MVNTLRVIAVFVFCILIISPVVLAADPVSGTAATDQVRDSLVTFLDFLYGTALRLIGLAVFSMFLIAGLAYMIPAVKGMVGDPVNIIKDAVIGLIVLASAYIILNSISPILVRQGGISLPTPVPPATGGTGSTSGGGSETFIVRNGYNDATIEFIRRGKQCGQGPNAALSCQPGYTCQGNVCAAALPNSVPLHAYCTASTQCAGGSSCIALYDFRHSGSVKKCCDPDEIFYPGLIGGYEYCVN